jgi:carboxyl-terminal processing protease
MKFRSFIATLVLAGLLLGSGTSWAESRINSAVLKGIVERFVTIHYSQTPLDDEISRKTFKNYLNRLDPGHYYFLESDLDEFQRYETRLDDLLRRGDGSFAEEVFQRFKTRLSERLGSLEGYALSEFDFNEDAQWMIDRKNAPYPKDSESAEAVWRTKVKFDLLTLTQAGSTMEEAKERLVKRIRGLWKDYSQYDDDDVQAMLINAVAAAYDPHSSYMPPEELQSFDIQIKLSLEGIGAVLRWEDGYTVVNSIVPGGAAARHGKLKVEDRIIAVAQGEEPFESVIDMRLNDVVQLIRGERGTKVRLQVLRKSEKGFDTLTFAIIRDRVILKDGEAKAEVFVPQASNEKGPQTYRIGVIELPSFYVDFNDRRRNPDNYKSSSRDVMQHLQAFKEDGVDGVILDLRNNGGGGLDEAINMSGLFIGRNPVVVVRQTGGRQVTVHRSRQDVVYDGPLMIMQNRYSASASEILAGAMSDYKRAILVGDYTSFGKGTVQNIVQLPQGYGALKVTIAQFYRVSGSSTQNRGVESDIILASLTNVREVGESTLENALPWRSISSVNFRSLNMIDPALLDELRRRSEKRQQEAQEFVEIRKEVEEYETQIKPMQYTSIKQMQEDFERRREQRDQELAAAKAASEDEPAEEETSVAESSAEESASDTEIKLDVYLSESIGVLEDYIRLRQYAKNSQ